MSEGPYSRLYHSLVDDPMFAAIYKNDAVFGVWCRLLMIADAMHPASAPLPRRNSSVSALIACGLIEERPGNRYVIRGMVAERERRSASARNAAALRWQRARNADPMPRRDETSKDKTSIVDANASNDDQPIAFMGFRQKTRRMSQAELLADIQQQHDEAFEKTAKVAARPQRSSKEGSR
jgi:hypothetical protein